MRLLVSSDAVPGGTPHGVAEACRRGTFDGLELSLAHARAATASDLGGAPTRWVRMPPEAHTLMVSGATGLARAAEQAARLGAGLLVYTMPVLPPPGVALVHGTDRLTARQASAWACYHGVGTAWEIDLATLRADAADAVLEHTGPTLAHLRLVGTDADHAACAVLGRLLAALALRGFAGTLVRVPPSGACEKPKAPSGACALAETSPRHSPVPLLI